MKIAILYPLFKKGKFSLNWGAIPPNVPPHLRKWHFAELYSAVIFSLHSSYKTCAKGGQTNDSCNDMVGREANIRELIW